ncbi:MAG: sigma-70 family RNA polymerase sigma factor [Gammaproteobacteria bacterium]|nr:sigma-70 family RNA polymerase sigma factor [Gammaproteobacteria bacterium]
MTSEAAFAELYRTHYRRVFELCRQLLGSADRAEDAAQEVFMRAHRHFDRFDKTRSFAAWVSVIANHHCIDVLRYERRWAQRIGTEEEERLAPDADRRGTLTEVLSAERAETVRDAVAELPDRYRLPLVLAYFQDQSYDEIAASLGLTRSHVGVLICRGKQKLRQLLTDKSENDDDLS